MKQCTGLFKVTPHKDLSLLKSLNNPVVQIFKKSILSGACPKVWLDREVCTRDEELAEWLERFEDKSHYHYIVTFNSEEDEQAAQKAKADINLQRHLGNSLSVNPVENLPGLLGWLKNLQPVDIQAIKSDIFSLVPPD